MAKHKLFETGIRRLGSKEEGFSYRYPEGGTVRENKVLRRIEELKIPPAYREVRVAPARSAKVQAVGYDSQGRLQYVYNPAYRAKKEMEKFARIRLFAKRLPDMRRKTSAHLRHKDLDREKVLACMTRLMNAAHFRVGEERYARNNKTYGIATIRRKHLRVEGDTMYFDYTGKWGKHQRQVVTDAMLREVVEECAALPGYEVFKYKDGRGIRDVKSRDLNLYVKEVMGDEMFTAKDFRTWSGTLIAALKLAELGATEDTKQGHRNVLAAVDDVAERLGNTRAIARASYINPRVFEHYMEGAVLAYYGERVEEIIAAEQGELTAEETALLELLNRKLRREVQKAA